MVNSDCPKCGGQGRYMYDDIHAKPCELCCEHDQGWWKLEQNYGDDNGKYACKKGCGTLVEKQPKRVVA